LVIEYGFSEKIFHKISFKFKIPSLKFSTFAASTSKFSIEIAINNMFACANNYK
jgi:hypothetical protein